MPDAPETYEDCIENLLEMIDDETVEPDEGVTIDNIADSPVRPCKTCGRRWRDAGLPLAVPTE